MSETVHLIVNADDFGFSRGVNAGIVEAHEKGIVTSTSLMVRRAFAGEAFAAARAHPRLGFGLHLDLSEWVYEDDDWRCAYERVNLEDRGAVHAEVEAQLGLFRDLTGLAPTHIDSHQHVARDGIVGEVVREFAAALGLPARHHTPEIRYCGDFYGQDAKGYPCHEGVAADQLIHVLNELPPGITEMGCHPGRAHDVESVYKIERELEIQALCDSRVRAAIGARGIRLVNFRGAAGLKL